jgi:hypothetical protein
MTNPINYDPNTPTVKLSFADWQVQFIQNFTQLANAFSQNHIPLNDPTTANRGNHTYIQMPEQTTDPQTGSVEFAIYSKDVENQTDQLFFQYPGNTPVVQFTNYQIYSVIPTTASNTKTGQTTYFTFLPGGLLVYFGTMGPFTGGSSGKNTLFLYPPVAKNIIGMNFCTKGTTPQYTPAAVLGTIVLDPIKGLTIDTSGIIKQIYVLLDEGLKNQTIDYCVVANI